MVNWSGSKRKLLSDRERAILIVEEAEQRRKWAHKQAIKDKLDLYGEDSLSGEEKLLVRLFPDFFYPERG